MIPPLQPFLLNPLSQKLRYKEQKQVDPSLSLLRALPHLACHHRTFYTSSLALHPVRHRYLPSKQKAGLSWSICAYTNMQEFEYREIFIPSLDTVQNELTWEAWYVTTRPLCAANTQASFRAHSWIHNAAQQNLDASHSNTVTSPNAGSSHSEYH